MHLERFRTWTLRRDCLVRSSSFTPKCNAVNFSAAPDWHARVCLCASCCVVKGDWGGGALVLRSDTV